MDHLPIVFYQLAFFCCCSKQQKPALVNSHKKASLLESCQMLHKSIVRLVIQQSRNSPTRHSLWRSFKRPGVQALVTCPKVVSGWQEEATYSSFQSPYWLPCRARHLDAQKCRIVQDCTPQGSRHSQIHTGDVCTFMPACRTVMPKLTSQGVLLAFQTWLPCSLALWPWDVTLLPHTSVSSSIKL